MKRLILAAAAALLLSSAPALAQTATDTMTWAGPMKQLAYCFPSGSNAGRCVLGSMALAADGSVDNSNQAFQGAVPMTVGQTYTAQRSIGAVCTSSGNVSMTLADGSTIVWPVGIGGQTLPFAVTAVNTSGTTATCAFYNLK